MTCALKSLRIGLVACSLATQASGADGDDIAIITRLALGIPRVKTQATRLDIPAGPKEYATNAVKNFRGLTSGTLSQSNASLFMDALVTHSERDYRVLDEMLRPLDLDDDGNIEVDEIGVWAEDEGESFDTNSNGRFDGREIDDIRLVGLRLLNRTASAGSNGEPVHRTVPPVSALPTLVACNPDCPE
jgi:hypothetical protein